MRRKAPVIEYEAQGAADDSIRPRDCLRIVLKLGLTAATLAGIMLLLWLIARVAFRLRYGEWYWD